MKYLVILLLLPLLGMGQSEPDTASWGGTDVMRISSGVFKKVGNVFYDVVYDTIPITIEIQYHKRDIPGLRDCYLINGEPWYRSTAPLTRGKWVKIRAYRWRISENWIKQ